MSYLVLARKWRPQTFDDVVGQRHVTQTLQNSIEMGRLAHAFIFSGARGVGKTSVARILAKAINCKTGPAKNPCNQCEQCREITEGRAVDVQEIDAASNRGIDEIRLLKENSRFRPSLCRYKVYIIDEAHMLTKEAFNALLKTLEEPPDHVYFILATTEPQKIPITIHSRCQHHAFKRLGTAALAEHLAKIIQAEGFGLNSDITMLLAREAKGSVRDALSLLDQVVAFGAMSLEETCEALGVVSSQIMRDMAAAVINSDIARMLAILDEVQGYGIDLKRFASDLALYFRDMLVLKELGKERASTLMMLAGEDIDELTPSLSQVSLSGLLQMLDALVKGLETIGWSSTPRISLEIVLMRLAHMREVVKIDEIIERLNNFNFHEAVETKSSMDLPEPCEAPVNPRKLHMGFAPVSFYKPAPLSSESWERFLRFVGEKSPPLASKLECCKQVDIDEPNGIIRLSCNPGMHYDLLSEKDNQARLQSLAQEFYRRPVALFIKVLKEDIVNENTLNKGEKSSERDNLIELPFVQEAMRIFKARVMDVKLFNKKDEKIKEL
ncbi:MAG: DNA polymerase III subunit gamma/tau [Dissulfurimicrobium sp.]|uniref:DNA polymerase III subunit gamma/tau n=1 Tax=Dissulfurimicrobium sp. TaxID=2022436 RepID=UPI00404A6ACC